MLSDGRVAGASTSGGVIVHELTADDVAAEREVRRYSGSDYLDVVVPWEQVVTWRVACECGWTGQELPAYDDGRYATRDCPEEVEERVFAPVWDAHVAPYVALYELDEITNRRRDLENNIVEKVRLARTAGASWAQVGRAAGLSPQRAQQRWSQRPPSR